MSLSSILIPFVIVVACSPVQYIPLSNQQMQLKTSLDKMRHASFSLVKEPEDKPNGFLTVELEMEACSLFAMFMKGDLLMGCALSSATGIAG